MVERLAPRTVEELQEIVAAALGQGGALEVMGRGTKRGLGRPVEAGLEVSLAEMRGISLYEPEELVLSAGGGTPLAEIEARLAENRQQLAFEPPDLGPLYGGAAGEGTIGGAIACNLSGPRRIKAGAARDHLLGALVVSGRGERLRAGGRVVKNVTGYDLCKLLAGSHGTLAIMAEVTLKVLPAPDETLTLVVAGLGRDAAFAALREALGSAYEVAGAACLPTAAEVPALAGLGGEGELALIRLEGAGPSVAYRAERLRDLLAPHGGEIEELGNETSLALWRGVRDAAMLTKETPLWRVSVPPTSGPLVLDRLEAELDELEWLSDWAGGLLWLAPKGAADGAAALIRRVVAESGGGHATLIRGDVDLRRRIEVFQPQPSPLAALAARVKSSFDPERILNPGRMYRDI